MTGPRFALCPYCDTSLVVVGGKIVLIAMISVQGKEMTSKKSSGKLGKVPEAISEHRFHVK